MNSVLTAEVGFRILNQNWAKNWKFKNIFFKSIEYIWDTKGIIQKSFDQIEPLLNELAPFIKPGWIWNIPFSITLTFSFSVMYWIIRKKASQMHEFVFGDYGEDLWDLVHPVDPENLIVNGKWDYFFLWSAYFRNKHLLEWNGGPRNRGQKLE